MISFSTILLLLGTVNQFSSWIGEHFLTLVVNSVAVLPFTYASEYSMFFIRYIDIISPYVVLFFSFLFIRLFGSSVFDCSQSFFYTFCTIFSAIGFYSAVSLIELALFWVFLNISIYGLILRNSGNVYATEAAAKYFLLGAFTTAIFFFGIFLNFILYRSVFFYDICFLIETSVLCFGWS